MLGGVVQFQDRQVGPGLLVEAGLGGRGGSCGVSRSGRHRAADDDVPARSNSGPRQAALLSSSRRVDDQPQLQNLPQNQKRAQLAEVALQLGMVVDTAR